MRTSLSVFTLVAVLAGNASAAEQRCTTSDTLRECFKKVMPSWSGDSEGRVQETMITANTGVSSLVSPTQSTAKDFLSILAAALAVPVSGDGSRPLTLEHNRPFHLIGGVEQQLKLQVVLAKPELSGELEQRLDSNTAAINSLKDSLSELDDATVSVTLDPSTVRFGRSLTPHRDWYESMLNGLALAEFLKERNIANADVRIADIPTLSVAEIETAANAVAASMSTEFADRFSVLLNNQPQFYGSVLYHTRKDLAGPSEHSARVTYEMGFHDLNKFYNVKGCAESDGKDPADCAQKLIDFANATTTDKDPADRVAFSLEYRRYGDLTVALPDFPSVGYRSEGGHTFVYSLAYGRNSMMNAGRWDVAVNYEDTVAPKVTDLVPAGSKSVAPAVVAAPPRDRFVASATYTYKMTESMAMPFSLVYANHASFLGDVDRKLSAHFGITFKMPTGN